MESYIVKVYHRYYQILNLINLTINLQKFYQLSHLISHFSIALYLYISLSIIYFWLFQSVHILLSIYCCLFLSIHPFLSICLSILLSISMSLSRYLSLSIYFYISLYFNISLYFYSMSSAHYPTPRSASPLPRDHRQRHRRDLHGPASRGRAMRDVLPADHEAEGNGDRRQNQRRTGHGVLRGHWREHRYFYSGCGANYYWS